MADVDLIALAEKCEAAEGPDREIDADIEAAFTDERGTRPLAFFKQQIAIGQRRPLPFTASLDAAMTLLTEDMTFQIDAGPAHWWAVARESARGRAAVLTRLAVIPGEEELRDAYTTEHGHAATPALALCAAALRARAA